MARFRRSKENLHETLKDYMLRIIVLVCVNTKGQARYTPTTSSQTSPSSQNFSWLTICKCVLSLHRPLATLLLIAHVLYWHKVLVLAWPPWTVMKVIEVRSMRCFLLVHMSDKISMPLHWEFHSWATRWRGLLSPCDQNPTSLLARYHAFYFERLFNCSFWCTLVRIGQVIWVFYADKSHPRRYGSSFHGAHFHKYSIKCTPRTCIDLQMTSHYLTNRKLGCTACTPIGRKPPMDTSEPSA